MVLPVPVAPATRPCRLSMPRGIRIRTSERSVAFSIRPPSSRAGPSKAYPGAMLAETGSSTGGPGGRVGTDSAGGSTGGGVLSLMARA